MILLLFESSFLLIEDCLITKLERRELLKIMRETMLGKKGLIFADNVSPYLEGTGSRTW